MTRDELIAAVPVYEHEGRPFYVSLAEIPQPWRDQFWTALYGSQCPKIDVRLPLKSGVLSFVQNVDKELRNGGKASTCGIHAGI